MLRNGEMRWILMLMDLTKESFFNGVLGDFISRRAGKSRRERHNFRSMISSIEPHLRPNGSSGVVSECSSRICISALVGGGHHIGRVR
jgi:hypothetical protein